jgi:hypothetical protein
MKKWLVYKCSGAPVERKEGVMYHSDYEASFDTWVEAEEYIAMRLWKTEKTDDYCKRTTELTGFETVLTEVHLENGRTRKGYSCIIPDSRPNKMSSLENYILKQITEIESKLNAINKNEYSENDLNTLFNRMSGQRDILYQCLTAHDNTYISK